MLSLFIYIFGEWDSKVHYKRTNINTIPTNNADHNSKHNHDAFSETFYATEVAIIHWKM
jgi:hypothetical protein